MSPVYRWFPPYFPFWQVHVPTPSDNREWNVELDPVNTIIPVPFSNGTVQVSLHRILLETGIALTHALSAFDPRAWFALYRYGGDFAGTAPDLRFYSGAIDKDSRLTAVASEEIATGITSYILREHLNLDHITDAYAAIRSGDLEYVNPKSKERPDYFCLDSVGEVVIAESKGATGTRSRITGRIYPEGWEQVQNVRPVNHPLRASCSRVVVGTHICIDGYHNRSETTTIIKDPEGEGSHERNPESDAPIRQAYAKALRFIGQDVLAERLLLKLAVPDIRNFREEYINDIPVIFLGATPWGDMVGFHRDIAKALFGEPQMPLAKYVPDILHGFREKRGGLKDVGYGLPNGIVALHNIV